ncbi:hypothetical protein GF336_04025 [Candidatus Woesearchaeota archaeon]|nr:hypothetical protein [Candidatus Woesearchaeota archaeon]
MIKKRGIKFLFLILVAAVLLFSFAFAVNSFTKQDMQDAFEEIIDIDIIIDDDYGAVELSYPCGEIPEECVVLSPGYWKTHVCCDPCDADNDNGCSGSGLGISCGGSHCDKNCIPDDDLDEYLQIIRENSDYFSGLYSRSQACSILRRNHPQKARAEKFFLANMFNLASGGISLSTPVESIYSGASDFQDVIDESDAVLINHINGDYQRIGNLNEDIIEGDATSCLHELPEEDNGCSGSGIGISCDDECEDEDEEYTVPVESCPGFEEGVAVVNEINKISFSKFLITFSAESVDPDIPLVEVFNDHYVVNNDMKITIKAPFLLKKELYTIGSTDLQTYISVLNDNSITHEYHIIEICDDEGYSGSGIGISCHDDDDDDEDDDDEDDEDEECMTECICKTKITTNGPIRCIVDRVVFHLWKFLNTGGNPLFKNIIGPFFEYFISNGNFGDDVTFTEINGNEVTKYWEMGIEESFVESMFLQDKWNIPVPGEYDGYILDGDPVEKDLDVIVMPVKHPWDRYNCFEDPSDCYDNDGDGYYIGGCGIFDCNDADNSIYPGAEEKCNGIDDDCDGEIDEGCPYCGDGLLNQDSEECDDGNNQDGDGCSSQCKEEYVCEDDFSCCNRRSRRMIFKMIEKRDNCDGTFTYRLKITNKRRRALSYVAVGLPQGVVPVVPADNSVYEGESNRYDIENPTNNPFYSIKYETIGEGIKRGEYDIFEFTLNEDPGDYNMRIKAKAANVKAYVVMDCHGTSCSSECYITGDGDEDDEYDEEISSNIPLDVSYLPDEPMASVEDHDNNKLIEFKLGSKGQRLPKDVIIEYLKEESGIFVRGAKKENNILKKVFIDKKDDENHVCILDRDAEDFDEMTEDCSAEDEIKLACPGEEGQYRCFDLGNKFKVELLEHTIVRAIAEETEEETSEGGSSGGGSGGGGGGGSSAKAEKKICIESWSCSSWGSCSGSGIQTRSCYDANSCGTIQLKPFEMRSCTPFTEEETAEETDIETADQADETEIHSEKEPVPESPGQTREELLTHGTLVMIVMIAAGIFTFYVFAGKLSMGKKKVSKKRKADPKRKKTSKSKRRKR